MHVRPEEEAGRVTQPASWRTSPVPPKEDGQPVSHWVERGWAVGISTAKFTGPPFRQAFGINTLEA